MHQNRQLCFLNDFIQRINCRIIDIKLLKIRMQLNSTEAMLQNKIHVSLTIWSKWVHGSECDAIDMVFAAIPQKLIDCLNLYNIGCCGANQIAVNTSICTAFQQLFHAADVLHRHVIIENRNTAGCPFCNFIWEHMSVCVKNRIPIFHILNASSLFIRILPAFWNLQSLP